MNEITAALHQLASGAELSRGAAREVMDAVMRGDCPDAAFGALFAMLHARGETIDELAGFAESMRAHVVAVAAPAGAIDTCGTGGDGAGTFNVSAAAALVAAGAGAVVAKHGNRAVSSSCGSADVLEALGGRLETDPDGVPAMLDAAGFAFLFAPVFHPSMRHAAGPRRALGMRTAFNYLGPITNPAHVSRQVVGVSDIDAARKLAQVLQQLGTERALVVHGGDGIDELSLGAPSTMFDVTPESVVVTVVDAEQLGLARAPVSAIAGGDAERNAGLLRSVLDGSAAGPLRDVVLLNAGAALVVADRAADIAEGIDLARSSISTGNAEARLRAWIAASDVGMVTT
ncbi:MAG: anthranilate phosphoribosyltransferase [Thermoleophilia bacterium]|nr:anthranilate phosphoribosyltransferase [Thermoleophilia bacterium]